MIVEVRGIGFWTRVRLPSTPLNHKYRNPSTSIKIGAYRNVFGFIFEFEQDNEKAYPLSYGGIQRWIRDEYGLEVSKSSILAVKVKCGADALAVGAGTTVPYLKSDKELSVLEAFKHFKIIE